MSRKIDLRVIKTQRLIKDSFLLLIDEKGFEDITINDIANKAQINRSTFYLHYTDKYDLLDTIVEETMDKIMVLVAPETHIRNGIVDTESFMQHILAILNTIAADALFYRAILGKHGMFDVRKKMLLTLKRWLEKIVSGKPIISQELLLELVASIYVETITWWVNNDLSYTPAYMADQLVKFLANGPIKAAGFAL